MPYLIVAYLPSILCAYHAVKTGRTQPWLFILVIAPGLGPMVYFFVEIIPELLGGRTARNIGSAARKIVDPEREYRAAVQALDDTPTIGNRIRLAQAAVTLGRWREADGLWQACAADPQGDDPVVLLGHAETLLELQQYDDALIKLEKLQAQGEGETGRAALAFARAYEGLGRYNEADAPYRFAADKVPGLEAGARYVSFLAHTGRLQDAEIGLGEIERRFSKISPKLRKHARVWRDLAARNVAQARGV